MDDLAPRLAGRPAGLEALVDFIREINASSNPDRIAGVLLDRAAAWLPGTCRAVTAPGARGRAALLAARGCGPQEEAAALAIGARILRWPQFWSSADLAADAGLPRAPAVSALALPLACRNRTVAVLVVLDRRRAACAPRLPGTVRRTLGLALEPAALALDNARRVQRAERLARTDDLTGLFNVRALNVMLSAEVDRALNNGQTLSLAIIDLDGFKRVNDRHGHARGSRALAEVAALIRESRRAGDFVARCGGDEFSVVLPATGEVGAAAAAGRLRARIGRHVFLRREGLDVRLTASVGMATGSGAALTAQGLIERADDAVYAAKAGGGNRIRAGRPAFSSRERTT